MNSPAKRGDLYSTVPPAFLLYVCPTRRLQTFILMIIKILKYDTICSLIIRRPILPPSSGYRSSRASNYYTQADRPTCRLLAPILEPESGGTFSSEKLLNFCLTVRCHDPEGRHHRHNVILTINSPLTMQTFVSRSFGWPAFALWRHVTQRRIVPCTKGHS